MSECAKGWEPGDGGNALHEQLRREHDSAFDAGFIAGHAASTRAAVIAELEAIQRVSSDYMYIERRIAQLRAEQELVTEDRIVSDGFGNHWSKCERADCELQVVRPGKVQCNCDSGNEQTGEGDING